MAVAVEADQRSAIAGGQAHLRARRLRRGRHLRHGARRPDTAEARCRRSGGTCRAGSRRVTGSRTSRSRGWPTRAASSLLTVDCGITAVDEVAAAKARGLEVIVTDHHRPGDDASRLPGRRDAAVRLPVPGALRHGRRLQARAGARRRRRAPAYLDLVALATIADVVPLVDENRALAHRGAACARADAASRASRR